MIALGEQTKRDHELSRLAMYGRGLDLNRSVLYRDGFDNMTSPELHDGILNRGSKPS